MYISDVVQYQLYIVHHIANYGIVAWGGAYKNVLSLLESLQRRILKVILQNDKQIIRPLTIKNYLKLNAYWIIILTCKKNTKSQVVLRGTKHWIYLKHIQMY